MAKKNKLQVIIEKIRSIFGKNAKKKLASAALGAAVGIGATVANAPKEPKPDKGDTREEIITEIESEIKSETGAVTETAIEEEPITIDDGISEYVIISNEGAKLRSSAGIDDNIVGYVNYDDSVLIKDDTITNTFDGHTWGQVIQVEGNDTKVFEYTVYVALDDDIAKKIELEQNIYSDKITPIVSSNGLQKYQDVEISQEDMKNLVNFTCSWENQQLYAYKQGTPGYDYNGNEFIEDCITQDGSQYICYDDGNLNYGFGVMVYANYANSINTEHIGAFKEYGYDITSQWFSDNCLNAGESTIPVDIVDNATKQYLAKAVWNIQEYLRAKDVNFSKSQILALASMSYQYGKNDSFIHHFIDSYIEHGGNVQDFIENYETIGGAAIFYNVPGGSQVYKGHVIERSDAYTMAFRDGIFAMGAGPVEEIVINEKNIEEMQQNVNLIKGMSNRINIEQDDANNRSIPTVDVHEDR